MEVLYLIQCHRYNIENLELSQAYLFWFDKLEKANYFLENVLTTMDENIDGQLMQFLLRDPVQDGGQWDMIVRLVEKVRNPIHCS